MAEEKLVEVKCQNGNCQNKVMVWTDTAYFGIICRECQERQMNDIMYKKK